MGSTFLLGFGVNERVSKSRELQKAKLKKVILRLIRLKSITYWPSFLILFQAECQNHIRIVAKLSEEILLICGTHAYKPKCRHYSFKVSQFKVEIGTVVKL